MCNTISRRHLLKTTGCALAGAALLSGNRLAWRNPWATAQAQADEPLHLCVEPPLVEGISAADAHLAGQQRFFWPTGSTLRVRFLNGTQSVQQRVADIAQEWSQYANIKFAFGDDRNAEIRIAFHQDPGSWSQLGTKAREWSWNQHTMHFGWLYDYTPLEGYRDVVLHEFGHALGLVHEHQSPASTIAWNEEAVYAYYSTLNWSREKIRDHIFTKYEASITQYSALDPTSIMMYYIPQAFTLDGFSAPWNSELSATDKEYIGKWYPFTTPTVQAVSGYGDEVSQSIGQAGETDRFTFEVSRGARYTLETKGATDLMMALFGPNTEGVFICENDDSGQQGNARIVRWLTPGVYTVRVRHFSDDQTGDYTFSLQRDWTE